MTSSYRPDTGNEPSRLAAQENLYTLFDDALLEDVEASGRPLVVVDIGCAGGALTRARFKSDQYEHVLGIDRVSPADGDSKFTFVQADVEAGGLEQVVADFLTDRGLDRVDVIYSALTLHHLDDPVPVLRASRRILGDHGTLAVRSVDDGTKVAFPDPLGNVARIIELTATAPGAPDRFHGRKLHQQLYRAGFRNIEIVQQVTDTDGRDVAGRARLFQTSFGYRADYLARAVAADPSNHRLRDNLAEIRDRLAELELDFERDDFFYSATDFGAIASA